MKTLYALLVATGLASVAAIGTSALPSHGFVPAIDEIAPGAGVQVGDLCVKGEAPPRPGLICLPAYIEIDGQVREEWDYESSYLLNGRKGDSVLSAGCGLIANLLRKVNPEQQYSHAGLMVADRHRIRHSTASVDWVMAHKAGNPPGTEGLIENALKFAWPGTLTQWADEAFEGGFVQAPSGEYFELKSFNPAPVDCGFGGQLTPDTVLKPSPMVEATVPEARARVEAAADAGANINGHYRFFGYSQPEDVLFTPAAAGSWADGTVGSVCSAFVWRSMKDADFTLEGPTIETDDVQWRGAQADSQTPDGMYLYTTLERAAAAQFIYDELGELVAKQVTGFEDVFVDVADDLGNQVVNCFGFDWCGETFSLPAAIAGCDPDDDRAQDSPCWRTHTGVGRAVSPDNMLNWDAAPAGPYGYREDAHFAAGAYHRVYRWHADVGTATVQGVVTDDGMPQPNAPVVVDGLDIVDFADGNGGYLLEAVPAGNGNATVKTCIGNRGQSEIVAITAGQTATQDLVLEDGCNQAPDPGKWRRRVRIHGTVRIVDTEDFGSDEVHVWPLDEIVTVEPNTETNPTAAEKTIEWTQCTGGEVRAKLTFTVRLKINDPARGVEVTTVARMYEGQSCNDNDLDGTKTKLHVVAEDASTNMEFVVHNEEFSGEDRIRVILAIDNTIAPAQ